MRTSSKPVERPRKVHNFSIVLFYLTPGDEHRFKQLINHNHLLIYARTLSYKFWVP